MWATTFPPRRWELCCQCLWPGCAFWSSVCCFPLWYHRLHVVPLHSAFLGIYRGWRYRGGVFSRSMSITSAKGAPCTHIEGRMVFGTDTCKQPSWVGQLLHRTSTATGSPGRHQVRFIQNGRIRQPVPEKHAPPAERRHRGRDEQMIAFFVGIHLFPEHSVKQAIAIDNILIRKKKTNWDNG